MLRQRKLEKGFFDVAAVMQNQNSDFSVDSTSKEAGKLWSIKHLNSRFPIFYL
jgi:hypothetical protein